MQLLRDDEPNSRRLLWQIRDTAEYAAAYEEAEPLVTGHPDLHNTQGLVEKALPSIFAQTYERLEIVIVGDAVGPEVEAAVGRVGDPRIRYDVTHRGPYPESRVADGWSRGPPCNQALRLARGRWIARWTDDDTCPPNRIELTAEGRPGSAIGVLGLRPNPATRARRAIRIPATFLRDRTRCQIDVLHHAFRPWIHRLGAQ